MELFKWEKDKTLNSVVSHNSKRQKKHELNQRRSSIQKKWCFSERRLDFSLSFRQIRPSEVFGARRKVALRGEANAWTLVLGNFIKLREVGVSPYLGFTLHLSTLQCFGWFEALNGRLIGPKT